MYNFSFCSILHKKTFFAVFKENILKKQQIDYDGGSELFTPTLTTNGLCYSFNGENYSSVWKESEVTNAFNELFPHNNTAEFFQGAAVTDGKILIQVFFHLYR